MNGADSLRVIVEWIGGFAGIGAAIGVVLRVGADRQEQVELVRRMEKVEGRLDDVEDIKTDVAGMKSDLSAIKGIVAQSQGQIDRLFTHLLRGARPFGSDPLDRIS